MCAFAGRVCFVLLLTYGNPRRERNHGSPGATATQWSSKPKVDEEPVPRQAGGLGMVGGQCFHSKKNQNRPARDQQVTRSRQAATPSYSTSYKVHNNHAEQQATFGAGGPPASEQGRAGYV